MKTLMFISFMKCGHENRDGAQELQTFEILMEDVDFEVVPRGPTRAIGKF